MRGLQGGMLWSQAGQAGSPHARLGLSVTALGLQAAQVRRTCLLSGVSPIAFHGSLGDAAGASVGALSKLEPQLPNLPHGVLE